VIPLLLRRLRGVLAMALLWALAWALVAAAVGWWRGQRAHAVVVFRDGVRIPVTAGTWAFESAQLGTVIGLVSGVSFALLLMIAERRRGSASELPRGRVALWGALAALLGVGSAGALFLWPLAAVTSVVAVTGAVLAGALLVLAQRSAAPRLPSMRPEAVPRIGSAPEP
jgi:hypothetical protein